MTDETRRKLAWESEPPGSSLGLETSQLCESGTHLIFPGTWVRYVNNERFGLDDVLSPLQCSTSMTRESFFSFIKFFFNCGKQHIT